MTRRNPRHALLALTLLLLQAGALLHLSRIPPELVPRLSLSLPLEFTLALAWALIFAWLAVTLWHGSPTCRLWQALALYLVLGLARLLFFARADYDRGRLTVLLLVLLPAAAILSLRRTSDRQESGP